VATPTAKAAAALSSVLVLIFLFCCYRVCH
jgi:hypothetical protein